MKDTGFFSPAGRGRPGRRACVISAVMTALLVILLFAYYFGYEQKRTLHAALEGMEEGEAVLSFSEDSGFFEDGFILKLSAMESVRQEDGVEIRYTLNGDEPTEDSLLYEDGIDLTEAVKEAAAEAERREAERQEAIRKAEHQKAAAEAERQETERREADEAGTAGEEDQAGSAGEAEDPAEEQSGTAAGAESGPAEELPRIPAAEEALEDALEEALTQPAGSSVTRDDDPQARAAGSSGTRADSPRTQGGEDALPQTRTEADVDAGEPAENADMPAETAASDEEKEETPSVEDGRKTWQKEIWTAASDDGVRPERTPDGIYVIPVRARLIQGEDKSPVVTRTYVIGPGVRERWKDVYVVSVTIDSADLFDYDKGFMVKGSHYKKDIENGVREDRAGNFYQKGDDWTRDGHVSLFTQDGEVLLEEDVGLSISGYSSRILPTRSFRAEASVEHGSSGNTFSLDIFTPAMLSERSEKTPAAGSLTEADGVSMSSSDGKTGSIVDVFRKIKFRTHGVPTYHIRSVRNQFAKQLTDECGFPGLTENRPGVMFLNGEFYTVCDITPSADTEYLCRLFGLNVPDAMEKYSGSDVDVYTKAKIIKLFTADLTVPANQEALERAVDMDNYLHYFALEVLLNNADWPYNNVTIWRYLGEEDPENPYTDGRIRFVLDDMDQILTNNLHGDPARWSRELIDYLMKDKGATFHHVMECEKYRDTFLTYVDDLLRTAFAPEHACAVLDVLYAGLQREYTLDYGEAFWKEMEHTAFVTKQNVREKEKLYRADITQYMGLTDRYEVRIEAGEGVSVTWNNDCGASPDKRIQRLGSGGTWTGEYYRGTSFTAEAVPAEGYRFAGWEVNGISVDQAAEPSSKSMEQDEGAAVFSIQISDALLKQGRDAAGGESVTASVTVRAVAVPE